MSIASWALLSALLGGGPSVKVEPLLDDARTVRVVAELSEEQLTDFPNGVVTRQSGRQCLTFSILDTDGRPGSPMLGDYERLGSRLTFTPRFRLTSGATYEARFYLSSKRTVRLVYEVAAASVQGRAVVTDVFPAAAVLPANSLKFYIHFSQPMREGRAIFDRIHLLDENGELVHDPWRRTELWTEDALRFTLWIHPGRVKQGVNLREDFGPVLHPGRQYTLLIDGDVQAQGGHPLKEAYRKVFRTVADDRSRPLPQNWKLSVPENGKRLPLRVEFGEPLDHALVQRCVEIRRADGQVMECRMTLVNDDSAALLTPVDPWQNEEYRLVTDSILEDLAGNTPVRIFDTDLTQKTGSPPQLQIPFRPASPVAGPSP